jgi:hypothetical protein
MAFQGFPVKIFLQNQFREGLRVTVPVFAGDFIINCRNMFKGTTVLNSQWTAYNILVENNTIVQSTQAILFCGKYSYHAKDVVLKNNLIVAKQNEAAFRFDKAPDNAIYINNFAYASKLTDHRGNLQLDNIEGVAFSTKLPDLSPDGQSLSCSRATAQGI